ncbi:MAG: S-layer homology domain-containing protein [Oscillospiraceae bacterium]|nr:S-layer homology domain-containing protein [Oscillospiraceae bacterium]
MKVIKKIISGIAAFSLCTGIAASAYEFTDMPSGEMGTALENAVNAGLMDGVTDTSIAPNDHITRAQMATIIVRAFGATEMSDKKFNDVAKDAWYAESVSKAVAMGAFEGDDDNNFNPENKITFQETYTVLSRMFGFEPYKSSKGNMVSDVDSSVLDSFGDKDQISGWAVNYAKYIVGNGGWTGIGGKLKPTDPMTRGEFALIMDKLVYAYVDDQAAADKLKGVTPDGAVLIRKGGIKVDGITTDRNLIITQGVDESGVVVTNTIVNGVTLILGGADKTPVPNSEGKIYPDESYVTIAGTYYDVRVGTPYVYLDGSNAAMGYYKAADGALVYLMLK